MFQSLLQKKYFRLVALALLYVIIINAALYVWMRQPSTETKDIKSDSTDTKLSADFVKKERAKTGRKSVWFASVASDSTERLQRLLKAMSQVAAPLPNTSCQSQQSALLRDWAYITLAQQPATASSIAELCPAALVSNARGTDAAKDQALDNVPCDELILHFDGNDQNMEKVLWGEALLRSARYQLRCSRTTLLLDDKEIEATASSETRRIIVLKLASMSDTLAFESENGRNYMAAQFPRMRERLFVFPSDTQARLLANVFHWLGYSAESTGFYFSPNDIVRVGPLVSGTNIVLSPKEQTVTGDGVYICGLVHNMAGIWSKYSRERLRFIDMLLGQQKRSKVFLKLVSSNNKDNTDDLIRQFITQELEPRVKKYGGAFSYHMDLMGTDTRKSHFQRDRGAYLAMMRNRAVDRVTYEYRKIIFTNDILTSAEDLMDILTRTAGGEEHYDFACGLDHIWGPWVIMPDLTVHDRGPDALVFYDGWVARTMDGVQQLNRRPYFHGKSLNGADPEGNGTHPSVQAYACWNGIVSIDTRVFLDAGIKFRTVDSFTAPQSDGRSFAACEAYNIGVDLHDYGYSRIYINPCVHSAYEHHLWDRVTQTELYKECRALRDSPRPKPLPQPILTEPPKKVQQCIAATDKGQPINEPDWGNCRIIDNWHRRRVLLRGLFFDQQQKEAKINRQLLAALNEPKLKELVPWNPLEAKIFVEDNVRQVALQAADFKEQLSAHAVSNVLDLPRVDLCIHTMWTLSQHQESLDCHEHARKNVLWLGQVPKSANELPPLPRNMELWVTSHSDKQVALQAGIVATDKIFIVPLPTLGSSELRDAAQKEEFSTFEGVAKHIARCHIDQEYLSNKISECRLT